MAKRRKNKIHHITSLDREVLGTFPKVGCISERQLRENFKVSPNRIKTYCKEGLVKKVQVITQGRKTKEKTIPSYIMTEKGERFAKEKLTIDSFYKSRSGTHDLKLAEVYFSLSKNERKTWTTENELREIYKASFDHKWQYDNKIKSGEVSTLDAYYTSDAGEMIGVEITTHSYRPRDIQAKSQFAKEMGIEKVDFIRA